MCESSIRSQRGGGRAHSTKEPTASRSRLRAVAGPSEQRLAEIADSFFRPAIRDLVPYEPGKPVEEVQRELGLDRVVKLASNEGPFGPFPAALEAIARSAPELNRYPDGGAYRLRTALAELHGLRFEEVAVGAGSDGLVDGLSQIALDPGDEIVCGWPSFPSYSIDARKLGAVPKHSALARRPLRPRGDARRDHPRTKLVYICHPNNPTGTMNTRAELDAYFDGVSDHVLTVLDQAYFEYIDDPDYADGIAEYLKEGAGSSSCGRSRRSSGLPGFASATRSPRPPSSPRSARCGARSTSRPRTGSRASEPRRRAGSRTPPSRKRGAADRGRANPARTRPRAGRAGRGELPLLRPGRGLAASVRAAVARGGDRPADARFRQPDGDPGDGRNRRGERLSRRARSTGPGDGRQRRLVDLAETGLSENPFRVDTTLLPFRRP